METAGDLPPGREDSAFRALLGRLSPDPDRAGSEFERLRRALTRFFDWRGAFDPEECADETLHRLALKLDGGVEVVDVAALAHGIARLVLLEASRARARVSGSDAIPEDLSSPETPQDDHLLRHLEACLQVLPGGERDLVLAYYMESRGRRKIESRRDLAGRHGLTDNALRSRVQRLRDRLEACVRRRSGQAEGLLTAAAR